MWFGVAATSRRGLRVIPISLLTRTAIAAIPDGKRAPMPPNPAKPNEWYRDTLSTLLDYVAAGKLEPLVAARIPLFEAARAHELLDSGGYAGKLVIITHPSREAG